MKIGSDYPPPFDEPAAGRVIRDIARASGATNGHHLIDDGDADCALLALRTPEASLVTYPDIGLLYSPETEDMHRDRTAY